MKKKLIIHVGWHKTGTTSIQVAFNQRRSQLKEHGVHYCAAFPDFLENHSVPIYSMFCSAPEKYTLNIERGFDHSETCSLLNKQNMQKLLSDIEQCGADTYLISGEEICMFSREELERMRDFFDGIFETTQIVCCVREPLAYMKSVFQQGVHTGWASVFTNYDISLVFLKSCAMLKCLPEIFGRENISVFKFEEAVASGDLVRYFAASFLNMHKFEYSEKIHNESVSAEAAILLSAYNRSNPYIFSGCPTQIRNNDLVDLLKLCPGRKFDFTPHFSEMTVEEINAELRELETLLGMELYPPLELKNTALPNEVWSFSSAAVDYITQLLVDLAGKDNATAFTVEERGALLTAVAELEARNPKLAGQLADLARKAAQADLAGSNLIEILSFREIKKMTETLVKTKQHFDPVHYLIINPDVLAAGVDPWKHYCAHGKKEGRDAAFIFSESGGDVPLK